MKLGKIKLTIPPKPIKIKRLPTIRFNIIRPFLLNLFLSIDTKVVSKNHHENAADASEMSPTIVDGMPSIIGLNENRV